jgi:S1-C subfamily serine protease
MYEQPGPYYPDPGATGSLRRRRMRVVVGAGALVAAAAIAGVTAYSTDGSQVVAGSGSVSQVAPAVVPPANGNGNGSGSGSRGGTGSTDGVKTGTATAAQQVGVVDVNTVLKYQHAAAAGTGMVLTPTGEVLTNNHVIEGATSISVRVVTTGRTYIARVVGTDPSEDVAVLQLQNATGLQPANLGNASAVRAATVGARVTGVGNAGGTGGVPSAASGTVVALDQSLTATDESGQNPERLTGMIETNAPIAAGDSGGPLYDSSDRVIGMDTAASVSRGSTSVGFAIPITRATAIAAAIEAGQASPTIHLGYPGFLGVSAGANPAGPGALVESVLAGGPAASAGISAGDVITTVDGTSVGSAAALSVAVTAHRPGQAVAVSWLDGTGQAHRAVVTLAAGPAD